MWSEVRKERKDYFLSSRKSTDGTVTILGESYATSSLKLTASTTLDLTLPPDFAELRTFSAITSGYEWLTFTLRSVSDPDYRMARRYPDATSPTQFYCAVTNERTLSLGPKTDTAIDTELVYVFQPADLDATVNTTLQMPYPLYEAVEAYATSAAFGQDDDRRAAMHFNIARDIVTNVISADLRQSSDPSFVETAENFF